MSKFQLALFATAAFLAPAGAAFAQHGPAESRPAPGARADGATPVAPLTVTGARPDFRSNIDRRSYSVAGDLQSATGSIADALRNVPSLEVDVQGNVSLRGDSNVTILIDGKPSGMLEGEGRGEALEQMSADQIDRVEVMTNPSAAFRPDGSGGIINLVTKKTQRPGATGTVRANVGNQGRYNGGVNGSYRSGRLTLSGDAGIRREHMEGDTVTDRETLDPATGEWLESRVRAATLGKGDMRTARIGVDFDATETMRLTAELRHRGMEFNGTSDETFEGEDAVGALTSAYARLADNSFERTNTEARAGFLKRFSGEEHELSLDLRYEVTDMERVSQGAVETVLPAPSVEYEDTRFALDQTRTELKGDYTRPFPGDARLRTGFEIEIAENAYDNFGARGPAPDGLVVDPARTNLFLYDQTVSAAYATYETRFGKLTAQGGLRLEQVNIDTNQVTTGIVDQNDYFRAYPTLHLGYELTDSQQVTASYSKRVQRPRADDLNPFVIYIDPFNLRAGNPDLEPTETNSFELGWQYRGGQTYYLATAYYRDTTGSVTDVVQDLGGGVLLTTRENLGSSRSAGLELVANGKITPKLSYNVSTDVAWREIDASNLGFTGTRSGVSVGGRASLNWQPTDKDFFQVNGFVMGQRLQAQGEREPTGMINLGYRRKINDQLSLVFTGRDVFETFEDETVIDTPTLRDVTVSRRHAGRALLVGLTYTFGGDGQRRRGREPGFDFDGGEGG